MIFKRMYSIIFYTIIIVFLFSNIAYAATYTKDLGEWQGNGADPGVYVVQSVNVFGFNETHGFAMPIEVDGWAFKEDGIIYPKIMIRYTLPDDGSKWIVAGNISFNSLTRDGGAYYTRDYPIYEVHYTPGTFTGVSIGQAVNAANNARTEAINAKNAANTAKSSADTAAARAQTAATNAANANTNAADAKNMLNGSSNGGKSLAATYDIAANIRMLQFPRPSYHTSLIVSPP